MKDVNSQKIRQDIGEVNKKYKLDLALPSVDEVEGWVKKLS